MIMILLILLLLYLISSVFFFAVMRREEKRFKVIDRCILILALLTHTAVIILRGIEGHRFPVTDTFETLLVFAWLVTAIGIFLYDRYNYIGIRIISGLAALSILLFSTFIFSDVQPLMPALRSGWLYFHVGAYFIAYASFAIGFGISLIFVVLSLTKKQRPRRQDLLDNLEGLIFRVIDIGFPFLTVGIACGAFWASISWGRFWNWDPKEVWALVTWLVYAGCLHLRHTRNLRGRYAAIMAIIGFIAIIFTYVGVNLLITAPTIHSYG